MAQTPLQEMQDKLQITSDQITGSTDDDREGNTADPTTQAGPELGGGNKVPATRKSRRALTHTAARSAGRHAGEDRMAF